MASKAHTAGLAHHFESYEQQREASTFGVWVFLVTEILFFGGLFTAYIVYRLLYPHAFALGSHTLDVTLGAINTGVLLTSSLTMALTVRSVRVGSPRLAAAFLIVTSLLGATFLGIKFDEYHHKFQEHLVPGPSFQAGVAGAAAAAGEVSSRSIQLFYCLYFGMTGLHALHMIVGIGLLMALAVPTFRGYFTPENYNFIEGAGLYWHFVDVIWIFLFPLLYLVGRHG